MSRRNALLLALLLALTAASAIVNRPWRGDPVEQTRDAVQPLFPGLASRLQELEAVEVSGAEGSVHLRRAGEQWVVEEEWNHPVDPERFLGLLRGFVALNDRDTVSDNPEQQGLYAVSEEDGVRVRLLAGSEEVLADLFAGGLRKQPVGSERQARVDFYVRPADSAKVVLAPFAPPSHRSGDWIAPRLLPAGIESPAVRWIQRVDGEGDESWRAVRTDGDGENGWRLVAPESGPAAALVCEDFVFGVLGLRAVDVAGRVAAGQEPDARYGFVTNAARIGVGDLRYEVQFGGVAPGGRYAWLAGAPFVYVVAEHAAERLRVARERVARG